MRSTEFLVKLFNERRKERIDNNLHESEFDVRDLIGKTIMGCEVGITYRNNPQYIQIIRFNDGCSLLAGNYGDGECRYQHFFLVDPMGNDKYASSDLLDSDLRMSKMFQ